jgi:hypothetical protein
VARRACYFSIFLKRLDVYQSRAFIFSSFTSIVIAPTQHANNADERLNDWLKKMWMLHNLILYEHYMYVV